MSSSSSLPTAKVTLPSLAAVLDMTSTEASTWCSKLGLPTTGSKKKRQLALIEHITAKQCKEKRGFTEEKLAFNEETTTFEWHLSKDELTECDNATKGKHVESQTFVDKNGIKWRIRFYPKGDLKSNAQKTAVFLDAVDMESTNAVSVRVEFVLCQVESGKRNKLKHDFENGTNLGWANFSEMPSLTASECPICLEQVFEKLATTCGHSFCAKCTVKMLTESARIKCPLCRRTVARSDELAAVRYSALKSFSFKATVRTLQLDKDMAVSATLGDVMAVAQSLESKFTLMSRQINERLDSIAPTVSGSKRKFSEMNDE